MSVTRIPTWNEIEEEVEKPSAKKNSLQKNMKKYYKVAMHTLTTMLDFSILASPSFLVLTCSGFLTLLGFFVPYMYITGNYNTYITHNIGIIIILLRTGLTRTLCTLNSNECEGDGKIRTDIGLINAPHIAGMQK